MEVRVEKAIDDDAKDILDIQIQSFMPLLNKYKDRETNPANETLERIIKRINNPTGGFYKILSDNKLVGGMSISCKEEVQFWISPMFILPSYQGKGIAQKAIILIESIFPQAKTWELATIVEESRNCYLYEKMGYQQTGVSKKLNDHATLIYYKKVCS